jgi:hypothetical protein
MPSAAAWPGYEPSPHFRMMTAFGLTGVAGAALFAHFEPVGASTGAHAAVTVRQYDAKSGKATGSSRTTFSSRQIPSAVVDWGTLPGALAVEGGWFDETGYEVASTGPQRADRQPEQVPMTTVRGADVPPGSYTFAVGRYQDGRMVEVLARVQIAVAGA